ncbi:putative signal peptide-containing protein [Cryptosporidium parvum]
MKRELLFSLKLLFYFTVTTLIYNKANAETINNKVNNKNNNCKRPSYLILGKNNILTPNYSKEVDCLGPPIYFFDVANRKIVSLEVACKDTFLLINNNGELTVRLTDEVYYVNDRKTKKHFFFDYNFDPTTFVQKEYNDLTEIEHKTNYLLENNFNEIPIDYDTSNDGKYLDWIMKTEFLGVITISDTTVKLPNYNFGQPESEFEIKIPVETKLFLIFIMKTNLLGIQNTFFAAFPIFFLSMVIFDVRKPLLKFQFDQIGSNSSEIYDIKKGVHYYKGLKLKINKIHGEKILFSESLFELEKLIKDRFEKLKVELDSKHNLGIINFLNSVNNNEGI